MYQKLFAYRAQHFYTATFINTLVILLMVSDNLMDHVLIDKRRHSYTNDVHSFRGADSDTEHYLVVAKLRERISVSTRVRQHPDLERFDLKRLDDVEVKKKYQVEISISFADLESLDKCFDIQYAWESIRENTNTSAKGNLGYQKLKHNKLLFDDKCSKLIGQRKQAKLQWLRYPNHINRDNLKSLRRDTSKIFRKRKGSI
jgi:hypothetical protein